jgi:hypothetical protein
MRAVVPPSHLRTKQRVLRRRREERVFQKKKMVMTMTRMQLEKGVWKIPFSELPSNEHPALSTTSYGIPLKKTVR